MRPRPRHSYEFGRFRLDMDERVLLRDGEVVALTQKAFDVLLALVERSGHIVEKEELMQKVWPDHFVEEGNLTQNIYTLRKILDKREDGQPYIQTIQRRGYRFTGEVKDNGDNLDRVEEAAGERGGDEEETSLPARAEKSAKAEAVAEAFVGREPEMETLHLRLEQAIEGAGRILFITGEAGQGKTSLANQFAREALKKHPEIIFSRGHCIEQYGSSEAYLPILEAFGALLKGASRTLVRGALRSCAPTWCLQFPSAFASTEEREHLRQETLGATKERMLREMGDCLNELATHRPVLLLLEDLHWADTSTTDLLRHLCHSAGSQRLLLIGTYRPEEVDVSNHPLKSYKREMEAHDECEEIALGTLAASHIAAYLDARFAPNDFSERLSELIQQKTHGHALFATRLAQYLAERGRIIWTDAGWRLARELSEMDLEMPESVLSMIRGRIEALDEDDRRALRHASIQGDEFLSTVVAESLGADAVEVEERLDRLSRANRLIRSRGEEELPDGMVATRYAFSHALYQNVLYGDMVAQRRRDLHRNAGLLLEQHYGEKTSQIAAQLAMHFERGRDFSRAVRYLTLVGDNSARVYANAEAARHYTRALELIKKLPAAEQDEARLKLHEKRGAVEAMRSRFDQAHDDFTEVLAGARAANDLETEQAALNGIIKVLYFARRFDEVARRTDEALALAARTGNEALRLETLTFVVQKQIRSREWTEAIKLAEQIIAEATAINHRPALLSGLVERGELHFQQCEYGRAEELLTKAAELASEIGDGFMHLYSLFFLGLVAGNTGRVSRTLDAFNEAARIAERNGDRFWLARLPNSLGWIYRELQDFDRALEHDRQGLEIGRRDRLPEVEANALLNFCQEYARQGESEKWHAAFSELEEVIERHPWMRSRYHMRLHSVSAEYWLAQANFERAEEHARQLLELTIKHEYHKDVAVTRRLLAEITIERKLWAEAELELEKSLALLKKYPAPLVSWKVYATLGRLRAREKKSEAAREAYREAARIVHEIAASINDEQLRATFLGSVAVREVLENN
jgi:DNA-binding winged helix-turn-helix (wHTH) protein/tetratricopeptide (TPR) repeat protein